MIDNNMLVLLITAVTIALIMQLFLEAKTRRKEPKTITKTVLKCTKCGYTMETNYEPGDFITLIKGKCPKCGAPMQVYGIFDIELEEKV